MRFIMDYSIDIEKALEALNSGGVIIYPTDTIWGIGCDGRNPKAVDRVFELKHRPKFKSMLILLDQVKKANRYLKDPPSQLHDIFKSAERPTTFVLSGAANLAENLLPEDGSIGIRIPKTDFLQQLLRVFDGPLVSTSANISGQSFDGSFKGIPDELIEGADYVVQAERDMEVEGKSSSIIRVFPDGRREIIRP